MRGPRGRRPSKPAARRALFFGERRYDPPMFDRPAAIAGRLKAPLALAGLVLALWFALQAALFRSGAYWLVAEPDSNAGAVTHSLLLLEAAHRRGRRTVLVLGDSRVGEGFSGPLAA